MYEPTENSDIFSVLHIYKGVDTFSDAQVDKHPDYTTAYNRLRFLTQFATAVHMASFVTMLVGVSVKMENGGPQLGITYGRIASCWAGLQENSQSILKDIAYRSITNEIS